MRGGPTVRMDRPVTIALTTPANPVADSTLMAIWPQVLELLRPSHAKAISVWLDPVKVAPISLIEGELLLECPNPLFADTLSRRLAAPLCAAVASLTGHPVERVRGRVSPAALRDHERRKQEAVAAPAGPAKPLESRPTWGQGFKLLEHFVVGDANRLAFDAVRHLIDHPVASANPLFLHGRSGLGKTHLVQGLAMAFRERHPQAKVQYMRCEQFTNDWLAALGKKGEDLNAFRIKMRHPDLLIIDDLHFLSKGTKTATINELYATFNHLAENGKKVVFTSDASPKDIRYLEGSFVQRFIGGLVVELHAPDAALRRDVIRAKARHAGTELPEDVVDYVADRITDNVREIEGAVNKLTSVARSFRRPIDLGLARQQLSDLIGRMDGEPLIERISREIAGFYGVDPVAVRGHSRAARVCTARHVAMYVLKLATGSTYAAAGREFDVGHTSVVYACRQATASREQDQELNLFLTDLLLRLRR